MSGFSDSQVFYKRVVGSNLESRTAFDGSVPYCVSCSSALTALSSNTNCDNYFSIIGQPNVVSTVANAHDGIAKHCIVNLRNISFVLSGAGHYWVRIAICDPTDFPVNNADHVYLYENVFYTVSDNSVIFNVPDITGVIVNGTTAAPLNVCCWIGSYGSVDRCVNFHAVAVVDD